MSLLFGTLGSPSGLFTHIGGTVVGFTPAADNVIAAGFDAPDGWSDMLRHHDKAIKTLIVPEGVKGFSAEFLENWAVTEQLVFPSTLVSIGTDEAYNVFARCYLPEITLPPSVKIIGKFAFGHTYIKKLIVASTNTSPYNRQFKDSTIEQLFLPKSVLETNRASIGDNEYGFYANFYIHCECNIIAY